MFCMHCGEDLPSDAFFCPNCGRKVEEASVATPPDASGQTARADGGSGAAINSHMDFAIVITVLAVMSCGAPVNLVLGIVAFLYANKVDQHIRSGNLEQAKGCANTAKTLCWIAVGIIALQLLAMFFFFVFMLLIYLPIILQ